MKLGKEIGCVMKVGKRALYDTRKADIADVIELIDTEDITGYIPAEKTDRA